MIHRKFTWGAWALVLAASLPAMAQELVLSGTPALKVYQEGTKHEITKLSAAEAAERRCVIREIGGKYYWISRHAKELVRTDSGAFTTFTAKDGSGYIRIITSEGQRILAGQKTLARLANPEDFGYVEHLTFMLSSFTYYGGTASLETKEQ